MSFPSPTGYYKVLRVGGHPYHGGSGRWRVGVGRRVEGALRLCRNGLHAVTLEHLPRWLGPAVHPVTQVSDERLDYEDKWVFRSMTIGPAYETWNERTQRLFACDCAERALSRVPDPDPRSLRVVEVARRYADGEATAEELDTAADEAMDTCALAALQSAEENAQMWAAATALLAALTPVRAAEAGAVAAAAARSAEESWQAERLASYLAGELS